MIRLVLFDIDGTLIHSGGAGIKAFAKAFLAEFGVHGADRLQFAGRTDISLVREVFTREDIEPLPAHFNRFFERYLFWLGQLIKECDGRLCPGVHDFVAALESLPQPPLIGLLTGNIRRGAEIKLKHFGIWEKFPFGGFADDHEERNQIAVAARRRGCERLDALRGEEILVIGDTPHDVRCGRAIEAKVLAVATGGTSAKELAAHNPDWLAADLTAISAQKICSGEA